MQQINLLTPALLPARSRYPAAVLLAVLAAVVAVETPVAWWYWQDKAQAMARHARVLAAFDTLNAQVQERDLQASLATDRADATDGSVAQAGERLHAWAEQILRAPPPSSRLLGLAEARLDGVWLNEIELTRHGFRLKGQALTADLLPEYLRRLAAQPGLAGTPIAKLAIESAEDGGSVGFAIESSHKP